MAKARMIHKKLSLSMQYNALSDRAKVLFVELVINADDEGRLRGEAVYVKAVAAPLTDWAIEQIEEYLTEIVRQKLIYRWEQNGEWYIEITKWTQHQKLDKRRFKPSDIPPYPNRDIPTVDNVQDNDTTNARQSQAQYNEIEPNGNKKESNVNQNLNPNGNVNTSESNYIADKDFSFKRENGLSDIGKSQLVNPKTFIPNTEDETAAKNAWEQLEPNNLMAFTTTYLSAQRRGLPVSYFYQFISEIKQDPTITNKGAVFNEKVKTYFEKKEGNGGKR